MIAATALMCLALNIYKESRGEPLLGQILVAQVTMNRAANDPKRVCSEVLAPGQFSWTAEAADNGKISRAAIPSASNEAWKLSKAIAQVALQGAYRSTGNGATYFHERSVKPTWAKRRVKVAQVGNHIFYR